MSPSNFSPIMDGENLQPSSEIVTIPIGFVRRLSSDEAVKDRTLISKIVIEAGFSQALDGVEDFSHLFVLFWLHQMMENQTAVLRVHPRGRAELPLVGVFATRAPSRPNPIGLTLVELVKRDANVLWVRGIDAFDGTPVLDIKPYDDWDSASDFKIPEWLEKLNKQHTRAAPDR
jgi:tRNA-Thr(GGU) m(6)t(6)A37 methyltransferase TsaA